MRRYFDKVDIVVVLKEDSNVSFPTEIDLSDYNVESLPFFRNGYEMYITKLPEISLALVKLFLKYRRKWDAVLIFEPYFPNHIAYLLCKIFRKPIVLFVDGRHELFWWEKYKRERLWKKILGWFICKYYEFSIKFMIKHATTIVDSKEVYDMFGNENKPHITISTTISSSDVKNGEIINRPNKDTVTAITACRIHPQKGLEYLIRAIGRVKDAGVNIKLNIIGPTRHPNYLELLKTSVRDLGISTNVNFIDAIGDRRELMKYYESADIFVLPSLYEGSPKVIPEAMACGLPIIASRVGSIPGLLIEDGVEGILVNPKDVDGLSDALIKLSNDTNLRLRMGRAALNKAKGFTLEVQLEKFADIIKETASAV
ncbi:MAG TPA: glycosyltransferase family 4 protein [Thermodesulfobacteriota bacterium]|nr:glycosyltransferase family 4 protein [Thermodesulfobacteriota bacterium]